MRVYLFLSNMQAFDFTFVRFETLNGSGIFVGSIRVNRIDRNNYSLSGNFSLNPPFTLEPEKYYVRYSRDTMHSVLTWLR